MGTGPPARAGTSHQSLIKKIPSQSNLVEAFSQFIFPLPKSLQLVLSWHKTRHTEVCVHTHTTHPQTLHHTYLPHIHTHRDPHTIFLKIEAREQVLN